METLYIVGANGAAKEIWLLINQINATNNTFDFKGFIDVNPTEKTLKIGSNSYPVFNESDFLKTQNSNINIAFAIGDATRLETIISNYTVKSNFKFPNLIHPSITINNSVNLGNGNIISEACVLTVDVKIDSFNYINRGVHIGHDTVINSFNVINPCAVISGGVTIDSHNLIGTNATVLQYLSVGSKNKIGAGAVITKSIKNNSTLVGVPAKSIKNE